MISRHFLSRTSHAVARRALQRCKGNHGTARCVSSLYTLPDHQIANGFTGETNTRWEELAALTQDPMIMQLSDKMRKELPLPKTLSEVRADHRAIVVTSCSAPFHVVDVNHAWENLCGYTRSDARDRKLGELLHGPDTEFEIAKNMVEKMQKGGNYSEAVLTNYTRDGRKFQNLVRLQRINSSDGGGEYLMGVLREVPNNSYPEEAVTVMNHV